MLCQTAGILIWMFCGKTANKEINKVHRRALCILLIDYNAPLDKLLATNEGKAIHAQNLKVLVVEATNLSIIKNPSFF